jgi:hypothetical protein
MVDNLGGTPLLMAAKEGYEGVVRAIFAAGGKLGGGCLACIAKETSLTCTGCKLVRYCSTACQADSWNGTGLVASHKKLCKSLRQNPLVGPQEQVGVIAAEPVGVAQLSEEPLAVQQEDGYQCTSCASLLPITQAFACSRCEQDLYCNEECQRTDWQNHKKKCGSVYCVDRLFAEPSE